MAIFRHTIGFERNPAVLSVLREQYATRRGIDRDLGISCTVRFFTLDFGGSDSNRASIQYDFESLAELQEATEKRNSDSRWTELNQALTEAGFTVTFSGIAVDQTPD